MKLEKILEQLNSFEKNSFLKIIDGILSHHPKNYKEVEKILSDNRDLKNMDNINVSKVFNLVQDEFATYVKSEFANTTSQLDILIDLISKDGKCIMRQDWFARLYESELTNFEIKLKLFKDSMLDEKSEIDSSRRRDYQIYYSCLQVAYQNDQSNNLDKKITKDEQTILIALTEKLGLSQEEIRLINYLILPIVKLKIDEVINDLKNSGIIFFSKKTNTIYIADEIVRILRLTRGRQVADKYLRRVLRLLKESQLNLICRIHNLNWKQATDLKLKDIINSGISLSSIFIDDIHKENATLTEKKLYFNDFCDKELKITPQLRGITIEDKLSNLIKYFDELERDEKVGISIEGYEKLLTELGHSLPTINNILKSELELHEENILNSNYLLSYNIKPRDLLELIPNAELNTFVTSKQIKIRGDIVNNILEVYKDSANLYLENYIHIAQRNLNILKENGIVIKEAELGLKFEELTKTIFTLLGFNIDDKLRNELNTDKDKIDIVINLGNNELILIECKSLKDSGYNKFSSVSRQMKSYCNLAKHNNFKVIKSLLIAPEFSVDFVKDCGLDYELNLSLITASTLSKINVGFKNSKHKVLPYNLLMRDVLIQEDRILTAIVK